MKILVVTAGGLGDIVLRMPLLAALRESFPTARISLAGPGERCRLALDGHHVDEVVSIDSARGAALFREGADAGDVDLGVIAMADRDGRLRANLERAGSRVIDVWGDDPEVIGALPDFVT